MELEQKMGTIKSSETMEELKQQLKLAGPLCLVSFLDYSLEIISVMFIGHLGELSLSVASMASSFAAVTGSHFLLGTSSALETFCGQAYGAQQYHMLGVYTQRAMIVLMFLAIPISIVWTYTGTIFIWFGQDVEISMKAETYTRWLIPSIFLWRLISGVFLCELAWSTGHTSFLVLMSGLLPNPKLEISMMSVSLTTSALIYRIPYGFGSAASTRVSNELGAGRPKAARRAAHVVMFLAMIEGLAVSFLLLSVRDIWGYLFTYEVEVVRYLSAIMPVLALSNFFDGIQGVLSGTARGCGWQKIGAFVNLGAYYLVGLPFAILLTFVFSYGGKGLWMGIISGSSIQALLFIFIVMRTNWDQEIYKYMALDNEI